MAVQATVTGKEGIAIAVTAKVYPNILGVKFNPARQTMTITKASGDDEDIDISGATTFTATISATAFTVTLS